MKSRCGYVLSCAVYTKVLSVLGLLYIASLHRHGPACIGPGFELGMPIQGRPQLIDSGVRAPGTALEVSSSTAGSAREDPS